MLNNDAGGIVLRIPRSLLLPPSLPPPLNWKKEHYPVVVRRDLIGLGIRRNSQVTVEWWSDNLDRNVLASKARVFFSALYLASI